MVSVASGGKADRIAARILVNTVRAGSATVAKYSSTVFGAPLFFFSRFEVLSCFFIMRSMLQGSTFPVHGEIRYCPPFEDKSDLRRQTMTDPNAGDLLIALAAIDSRLFLM